MVGVKDCSPRAGANISPPVLNILDRRLVGMVCGGGVGWVFGESYGVIPGAEAGQIR